MKDRIISLCKEFFNNLVKRDKDHGEDDILKSIDEAHREWIDKEKYFNHATDPDLIDFAIYDMETSKKKYNYLLKRAKKEKNM